MDSHSKKSPRGCLSFDYVLNPCPKEGEHGTEAKKLGLGWCDVKRPLMGERGAHTVQEAKITSKVTFSRAKKKTNFFLQSTLPTGNRKRSGIEHLREEKLGPR